MKFQTKLAQSLAQLAEELLGICAVLKAIEGVIRIAHDDHLAACMPTSPLLDPHVQHVVQVEVPKQWRHARSLWDSFLDPAVASSQHRGTSLVKRRELMILWRVMRTRYLFTLLVLEVAVLSACKNRQAPSSEPPVPATSAKKVEASADCVADVVSWEKVDPQTGFGARSLVTPCRHYERLRLSRDGTASRVCEADMLPPGKGNMFNVADLKVALTHTDVIETLQRAPVTFSDPEANGVFRLSVRGKRIELARAGNGAPPPPGVAAAAALLNSLDVAYGNNNPDCKRSASPR